MVALLVLALAGAGLLALLGRDDAPEPVRSAGPALMIDSPWALVFAPGAPDPAALAAARRVGARLLRGWAVIDRGLEPTDRFVAGARRAGFGVYLTITYRRRAVAQPAPDAFAERCSEVAARYRGRIWGYGVWNEPNLWVDADGRGLRGAGYGALYRACERAIRRADPDARVLIGELANGPRGDGACRYLERAVAGDEETTTDAVAIHPYQMATDLPVTSPLQGDHCRGIGRLTDWPRRLIAMTRLHTADGATPGIAITEYGECVAGFRCGKSGTGIAEPLRAERLQQAIGASRQAGVRVFGYYHLGWGAETWNSAAFDAEWRPTAVADVLRDTFASVESEPGR